MKKEEKQEKKESLDISIEDRKIMIQERLDNAMKERDNLTSLIFKCQGALELLDSMDNINFVNEDEKND